MKHSAVRLYSYQLEMYLQELTSQIITRVHARSVLLTNQTGDITRPYPTHD